MQQDVLPSRPQFIVDDLADYLICECMHRISYWPLRAWTRHLDEQMTMQQLIQCDKSLILPNAGDLGI